MKNKILAILLLVFAVSCTKENTSPQALSINGYWYDAPSKESASYSEYISLTDSIHIFKNLATKKEYKSIVYVLPLGKIFINGSIQNYKFDAHNLQYGAVVLYR